MPAGERSRAAASDDGLQEDATVTLLRPLRVALAFLTRLPVGASNTRGSDLGRSLVFFPVVGLGLGFALLAVAQLSRAHLSADLVAVGVVALLAALTGGLHLDGLADVFDALAGGSDRERMLAIMRDSRIGALGAAAMLFVLLGKVFAVASVLEGGQAWALVVFPAAARWCTVALVVLFPSARDDGLGASFHEHARVSHLILASVFAGGAVAAAGTRAMPATAAALLAALLLGAWMRRRLGGLTGDVYGAAVELSELAFLVAAAAIA